MKRLAFATLFSGLFLVFSTSAQTNEYYQSEEARQVIDKMLDACGGITNIQKLAKLKLVMRMSFQGANFETTIYQTPTKIRREMVGPQRMIHIFDGTNTFFIVDGSKRPAPASLTADLKKSLKKGIMQQCLIENYLGRNSFLSFKGTSVYEGRNYYLIETKDALGDLVQHFLDQKTYLEQIEVTLSTTRGKEIQTIDSYRVFKGITYPEKTTIRNPSGEMIGQMQLIEVSDTFDTSVFDGSRIQAAK